MATCREVIALGLKQAGVIPPDESPTAAEAATGLDVLQSLYRGWFSAGEFGSFEEVYTASDRTAQEQERITVEGSVVVTLPESVGDGTARRAPYELSAIEVVQSGDVSSYVWERTAWVNVNALTLGDDAPLAHYGQAGLSACFAMHYAEMFGAQIGSGTKRLSDLFKVAFRSRRIAANPRQMATFL